MNFSKLSQKLIDLATELSKRPGIYLRLAKIVNALGLLAGFFMYILKLVFFAKPTNLSIIKLSPQQLQDLKTKADLYLGLGPIIQDEDGFVQWDQCDSLIFSGLYGTVGSVKIDAARDSEGMWHRRSLKQPECYCEGSDGSSISRDMLIGLLWFIWVNKRLDLAEDLFNYGRKHSWIMGLGDISRIYFTPGLQATLAEIIVRSGGPNHRYYREIPQYTTENTGFAAHLDMLHLLLRAELTGYMSKSDLEVVTSNYSRVKGNPFYSYVYHRYTDGDQSETVQNLLNSKIFPADRLPSTLDRAEPWINQRDLGPDWEPSDQSPPKVHSGGDFLFVYGLLMRGGYGQE